MSTSESFADLLRALRNSSDEAAAMVFERYTRRLIGLARKRLDQRLQGRLEPDDVIQSVYGSFFRRLDRGEFEIEGWDSLWALLAQITVFKCNRQIAFHRARKRDARREGSLPALDSEGTPPTDDPFSQEPSPEEVVALEELVESLQRGLSADQRRVLTLRLQGYSPGEISGETGLSERTVARIIRMLKEYLQEKLGSLQG